MKRTIGVNKGTLLTVEEQEQIKVLHAEGRTYHAIAKRLGRSPHTVKAFLVTPEVQEKVAEIKQELGDMFEGLAKRMIVSITDEDIKKLDAYRRTLSGGIAVDKARLLKGQSTENVSVGVMIGRLLEHTDRVKRELAELEGLADE